MRNLDSYLDNHLAKLKCLRVAANMTPPGPLRVAAWGQYDDYRREERLRIAVPSPEREAVILKAQEYLCEIRTNGAYADDPINLARVVWEECADLVKAAEDARDDAVRRDGAQWLTEVTRYKDVLVAEQNRVLDAVFAVCEGIGLCCRNSHDGQLIEAEARK